MVCFWEATQFLVILGFIELKSENWDVRVMYISFAHLEAMSVHPSAHLFDLYFGAAF